MNSIKSVVRPINSNKNNRKLFTESIVDKGKS